MYKNVLSATILHTVTLLLNRNTVYSTHCTESTFCFIYIHTYIFVNDYKFILTCCRNCAVLNALVVSHLLQRELSESGQRAGEQPDYEGGRRTDDVHHGRWQNRDVRVLPGEGVQQSHHGMATFREGAKEKETAQHDCADTCTPADGSREESSSAVC